MEKGDQKVSIIEDYPELKKDVSVLKIMMDPFELYILKVFLNKLTPMNVRTIYDKTLRTIFAHCFYEKQPKELSDYNFMELLHDAGYEKVLVNPKEAKKSTNRLLGYNQLTWTESAKEIEKILKSHNIKYPSYEKIRGTCEKFVANDVLQKRQANKKILYNLNPAFYAEISDRKEDILKL